MSRSVPGDKTSFRKPLRQKESVQVSIASVKISPEDGRYRSDCVCGWIGWHRRLKVVEDKTEAHIAKKHHGQAMWL